MLLDEELPAEVRIARAAPSSEDDDDDDEDQEEDEKVTPISSQEGSSQEEVEEESESAVDDEEEERGNLVTSETDELRHRLPRASDGFETKTSVAFVSEDGKTVRRTTTTTTRVVKASDLRSDGDAPRPASAPAVTVTADQKPTKKKSSCLSLLFQLIVIAIIVFFVYVIVSGPSSPLGLPEAPHDEENPPVRDDGG